MPRIGARMIKTSISVFLCFIITMLRGGGIPFYSAIAAVLCTQPEMDDSLAKGKSRIIATFIGGFVGMLTLFFFQHYMSEGEDSLRYLIISLILIPLIYVTVLIKQPASSYLTCVVFMCVTVSHAGDRDPVVFALNRMIDTLIGIFVALGVNAFRLPHHRHKEVLLDVPLSYLVEHDQISTYTRIHMNRLIKEGANMMITASHTPAYILQVVHGIKEPLQFVLMDGVLRYDRTQHACTALHTLSIALWHPLYAAILKQGYSPFLYECKDDVLYIHHGPLESSFDQHFYRQEYKLSGQCFHLHEQAVSIELHQELVMMLVLVPEEALDSLLHLWKSVMKDITWVIYDDPYDQGIKCLRLYSNEIAAADPAEVIQSLISTSTLYKVRHQGQPTCKEVIRELHHVFYRGLPKKK